MMGRAGTGEIIHSSCSSETGKSPGSGHSKWTGSKRACFVQILCHRNSSPQDLGGLQDNQKLQGGAQRWFGPPWPPYTCPGLLPLILFLVWKIFQQFSWFQEIPEESWVGWAKLSLEDEDGALIGFVLL